jgi:hypothetical protein
VNLEVTNEMDMPIVSLVCPHQILRYSCSSRVIRGDLTLTWNVTYYQQLPIIISYDNMSPIGTLEDYSPDVLASLTLRTNQHMASVMSLNLGDRAPTVRCTISNFPEKEITVMVYGRKLYLQYAQQ